MKQEIWFHKFCCISPVIVIVIYLNQAIKLATDLGFCY